MSTLPVPLELPLREIHAPSTWQRVDFVSDIHLEADEPATFAAWAACMLSTPADALFILGDLFEVWIGDDTQDAFALQCIDVLRQTAQRRPLYFMCGNRDFLVGPTLLLQTGMQGLPDPCVLQLGHQRFLLSHGDALCLDDRDYLAFRTVVRTEAWQTTFLAKPLAERQAIARALRTQSENRKQTHVGAPVYADVDADAARAWLQAANAQVLIHGHTHRPAVHDLGHNDRGMTCQRWVLSDWHATTQPPRLEVLSWLRAEARTDDPGLRRLSA